MQQHVSNGCCNSSDVNATVVYSKEFTHVTLDNRLFPLYGKRYIFGVNHPRDVCFFSLTAITFTCRYLASRCIASAPAYSKNLAATHLDYHMLGVLVLMVFIHFFERRYTSVDTCAHPCTCGAGKEFREWVPRHGMKSMLRGADVPQSNTALVEL